MDRMKSADLPIKDMLLQLLNPFLKLAERQPPEVQRAVACADSTTAWAIPSSSLTSWLELR